MGLITRCIFCLQEDGLIFEGGGLIPVTGGRVIIGSIQ